MLSVLFRRNFALLWSAGTVSLLGDWVLFAALPYYIYEQTGSSLATGAMFAASTLPRVLFGSVAGVFVDRWDRKHTMIASDLLRAALLLLLLGVPSGGVWLIYVVAFAETTVSLFFGPAKAAVTPRLAGGKEHLLAANALNGLSENLSRLLGPFVGGALLAASGLTVVVLADIASYVLSALLMTLIAIPRDLAGKAQTIADVPAAIVAAGRRWQRF